MRRLTKAHIAAANRIARRYGGRYAKGEEPLLRLADRTILVETVSRISEAIQELLAIGGPCYIAVTNKEALPEALRLVAPTRVGLMDPQGDIVREATNA